MSTLVMKFGGTSVGSVEAIEQAAGIVLEQAQKWERLAVVVSAMSGVTDALTQGTLTSASGDLGTLRGIVADLRVRHYLAVDKLLCPEPLDSARDAPVEGLDPNGERAPLLASVDAYLDEFDAFCRSVCVLGEVTPRAMDAITSLGERINARILAALLRQRGARSEAVDATELIVTDDTFQDAAPLMDATRAQVLARLAPLLDEGVVPIITGFIAATQSGVTTTLGRGGSDYSAAIVGDCLDADEVWTWTDVDGVMTADPRLVPDARVIPTLSYGEVGELAYFGAKVLHPRTIRPVVERGIPLWVKNTFNPDCFGTCIVGEHAWCGQGRHRHRGLEHGHGRGARDDGRTRHRRPHLCRRRQPGSQRAHDLPGIVRAVHLLCHPCKGGAAGRSRHRTRDGAGTGAARRGPGVVVGRRGHCDRRGRGPARHAGRGCSHLWRVGPGGYQRRCHRPGLF